MEFESDKQPLSAVGIYELYENSKATKVICQINCRTQYQSARLICRPQDEPGKGEGWGGCQQLQPWLHWLCQPEFKLSESEHGSKWGWQVKLREEKKKKIKRTEVVFICKHFWNQSISNCRVTLACIDETWRVVKVLQPNHCIGRLAFIPQGWRELELSPAFGWVGLATWDGNCFVVCKAPLHDPRQFWRYTEMKLAHGLSRCQVKDLCPLSAGVCLPRAASWFEWQRGRPDIKHLSGQFSDLPVMTTCPWGSSHPTCEASSRNLKAPCKHELIDFLLYDSFA